MGGQTICVQPKEQQFATTPLGHEATSPPYLLPDVGKPWKPEEYNPVLSISFRQEIRVVGPPWPGIVQLYRVSG